MGVDGMNNADIFDEYFDDEKPKDIVKNCSAYTEHEKEHTCSDMFNNEIEKLYKNAGVELVSDVKFPTKDANYNVSYPPFTAETQLELIRWLSKRRLLNVAYSDKDTYQFFNTKCAGSFCSDLAAAIATLVQCELDFCTEEEKQQIKEILK